MTREELKEHCEKQVQQCEFWARARGEEPGGKVYEEHKLILELLKQEPFINKPCISVGVCEHDKMQVLDRIKADIEKQQYGFMNSTDYANGVRFGLMLAYKIIKKYKKEIEG